MTFAWVREEKQAKYEQDEGPLTVDQIDQIKSSDTFPTVDDLVDQAKDNVVPEPEPIQVPEFAKKEFTVNPEVDAPVDVVKPIPEPEPDPRLVELQSRIILVEQDRDDLIEFVKQNQEDYDKITDLHQRSMQREVVLKTEIDNLAFEVHQLNEELLRAKAPPVQIEYQFEEELHEDIPEPVVEEHTSGEMTKDTQTEISNDLAEEPLPEPEPQVIQIQEAINVAVPETPPVITSQPVEEPKVEEYITDAITKPIETILTRKPNTGFGTDFPNNPVRGDLYLRTDFKPTRLFKWNDTKWIEVNKAATDAYVYNDAYIQFLAEKLSSGEYSLDDVSDIELSQIQTLIGGRRG